MATNRRSVMKLFEQKISICGGLVNEITKLILLMVRRIDILLSLSDLVWLREILFENTVREWNVVVGHE